MKTRLHTLIFRALLMAVLMAAALPASGYDFMVDSIEYESLSNTTVKAVALTHTTPIQELIFPDKVNNKSVVRIEFPYDHTIGKFAPGAILRLPNQLQSIGNYSFRNTTISQIYFNPNLKEIEESAFLKNPVVELDFPKSLTKIGTSAFYECTNLVRVNFPADSKLTDIDQLAFSDTQIEELVLPDSCRRIDSNAFQRCYKLRKVVLPAGLKNLGRYLVFMTNVDTLHLYAPSPQLAAIWVSSEAFVANRAVVVHIPVGVMSLFENSSWNFYQLVEDASCGNSHVVSVVNKTPELGNITIQGGTFYKDGKWLVNDGCNATIKLEPAERNRLWYCLVDGNDCTPHFDSDGNLPITNVVENVSVEVGFLSHTQQTVPFIIKQTDGGSLTLNVYENEPLKLNIKADEGWSINSVTLNGKDITKKLDGYGDLTIRKVNGAIVVGTTEVDEAAGDTPIMAFVAFENEESSISKIDDGTKLKVLGMKDGLRIENLAPGQMATVTDIAGRVIRTLKGDGNVITLELPSNIYLINSNGVTVKIAI
ncbi:MAG: leucine-rich repeat protein [Muribaculaceae bacterium]|nr:leucine-rich repeat protein [Muribaculaceae bacterium]